MRNCPLCMPPRSRIRICSCSHCWRWLAHGWTWSVSRKPHRKTRIAEIVPHKTNPKRRQLPHNLFLVSFIWSWQAWKLLSKLLRHQWWAYIQHNVLLSLYFAAFIVKKGGDDSGLASFAQCIHLSLLWQLCNSYIPWNRIFPR